MTKRNQSSYQDTLKAYYKQVLTKKGGRITGENKFYTSGEKSRVIKNTSKPVTESTTVCVGDKGIKKMRVGSQRQAGKCRVVIKYR